MEPGDETFLQSNDWDHHSFLFLFFAYLLIHSIYAVWTLISPIVIQNKVMDNDVPVQQTDDSAMPWLAMESVASPPPPSLLNTYPLACFSFSPLLYL